MLLRWTLNRSGDPIRPGGNAAPWSVNARANARCSASTSIENALCSLRLAEEHRPGRDVVVPFDEDRPCSCALHEALAERPNLGVNGTIMRIDEQRRGWIIGGKPGVARKVNLADMLDRKVLDIGVRI